MVADTYLQKLKTATLLLLRKTIRVVVTVIVAQNQTCRCNGYCCAKPNATIVDNATLSIEKVERMPGEMHKVLKLMMGGMN